MKPPEYMLFRLVFENREDLFRKPIKTDEDLTSVIFEATSTRNHVVRRKGRSEWRWSLNAAIAGNVKADGRSFVVATFSHETIARPARHVSPSGVSLGVTAFNPPAALPATVIFDLERHIVAIEEVPAIVQTKPGWRSALEAILDSASNWSESSSVMKLVPLAPRAVIYRQLNKFKRVTRLQATLRLPNPDITDLYRNLYSDLKEGRVDEITEDLRSEKGLNLEEGTLPRAIAEMAMNGYRKGKIRFTGFNQQDKKDFLLVTDDVARIEGLRQYVEGRSDGAHSKEAQRVAADVIHKIDELFPRERRRNDGAL